MPTYEYKCDACGHAFEKFQSITAEPIKKCPVCGKNKVKRLIGTGAGLIFKGSGFYITDYRDAGYKEKAKAESGAGSDAGKSGGESKDGGGAAKETKAGGDSSAAAPAPASSGSSGSDAKPAAKAEPPKPAASKSAAKPASPKKK